MCVCCDITHMVNKYETNSRYVVGTHGEFRYCTKVNH